MLYHLTLCRNFRDRSLCAWSASSGEFLFARRYCHGGEVTAVDVTAHGSVIVTGSRDTSVLVWGIQVDHDALMPVPMRRHAVEDRVWSVAVSSGTQQVFFFENLPVQNYQSHPSPDDSCWNSCNQRCCPSTAL